MKVDLKDTYFTIPIRQEFPHLLRFTFQEESYKFTCLPFSLSLAPWVFTKTLKLAVGLLRELGIQMVCYIDDMLILAESRSIAQDQVSGVVYLLECLGFTVNFKKSVLEPTQTLEFLGITVDTVQMTLSLPPSKIKKIRAEARKLQDEPLISAHSLARLLGRMNAASHQLPYSTDAFRWTCR